ncbi:MAG: hypothetical protein L0Y80_02945 [Ignavibacteriae bacterium]|nr:hypothetical protein [Ignavibacteriota bacterium]
MKNLLHTIGYKLAAFLNLTVLNIIACNETSNEPPEQLRLAPISSLSAFSAGPSSVGLTWTATTATNTGYMENHELIVRAGTDTIQAVMLPILATATTIQGLTEGTIYTFALTVRANETSPYENSPAVTINWSPATRYIADAGTSAPLQLYESGSIEGMHALRFYSDSVSGPRLISLSSLERATMDVYLLGTPSGVQLRSGFLYNDDPAGRDTKFADREPVGASSLNNPQTFPPSQESYTVGQVNISSEMVSTGQLFFARTVDNHYVRILVLRSNGTLIQGTAPNRYITVSISYQSVPGVQYAHYGASSAGAVVSTIPFSPS